MTARWLLAALPGFVAIDRQWSGAPAGQRGVGAALVSAGVLAVICVLALRP